MEGTNTLVLDAEPLIAYFTDEPGSDTVEGYLARIEEGTFGAAFLHDVNRAEVFYICERTADERTVREYLASLQRAGISFTSNVPPERAGAFKNAYNVPLGDAFALATADEFEGALVVGADDHFDEVTEVPIERFREDSA